MKKMEEDCSQSYPLKGEEAMGINLKHWQFFVNIRNLFHNRSCQTEEYVFQEGCRASISGHAQNLSEHSPKQPALGHLSLSKWVGPENL